MHYQQLLWVSAGLAIFGVGALASSIILLMQRRLLFGGSDHACVIAPCAGPIARLDFADSLDPTRFAEAAEAEAAEYTETQLRGLVADSATITIQTLRTWHASTEMVVAASVKASEALRTGKAVLQQHRATGLVLPHVTDAKTGQVIEVLKEVGKGRKAVAAAAAVTSIVVSASHMIASADLARSLAHVDKKVDLLLALRRIDQVAALERVYVAAKELLVGPLNDVRSMEIWRLRGELRELRASWRREFEHHLSQIENPADDGWFNRLITLRSSYDERIAGNISRGTAQLMMVEYSLRLDHVLAIATGTWDKAASTLRSELAALERIGKLLEGKAELISLEQRTRAQPMVDEIAAIVGHYRNILPNNTAVVNLAEGPILDRVTAGLGQNRPWRS